MYRIRKTNSFLLAPSVGKERFFSFSDYGKIWFSDSNASYLEEQELSRPPSSDEMDFDALLRMSQKSLKSRKESCKGRYMY